MYRKPCFLWSSKFLSLRKLISWKGRYNLFLSRKLVFTDTVLLMTSLPMWFINIYWFSLRSCTCRLGFDMISRPQFFEIPLPWRATLIKDYNICLTHSNYFNVSCILFGDQKFPYKRCLLSGSLLFLCRSEGLVQRIELIKAWLAKRSDWRTGSSTMLLVCICAPNRLNWHGTVIKARRKDPCSNLYVLQLGIQPCVSPEHYDLIGSLCFQYFYSTLIYTL